MEEMVDDSWRTEELPDALKPMFDAAANWAAWTSDQNHIDFERLYTVINSIAEMSHDDLISFPFSPHRGDQGFTLKAAGSSIIQDPSKARHTASQLREQLKRRVHDLLSGVNAEDSALLYAPLFGALHGKHTEEPKQLFIFTTNYDRAIENIWRHGLSEEGANNYRLIRGFTPSEYAGYAFTPSEYDTQPDQGEILVKLFKLHGSLNWIRQNGQVLESPTNDYLQSNAVIYPLRTHKTSDASEPFKTLFQRFEHALQETIDILLVIGSSLRDRHIRQTIRRALAERQEFRVVIHDPNADSIASKLTDDYGSRVIAASGYFGDANSLEVISEGLFEAGTSFRNG
jgi:NAD-dependent SIR2 family protein deacetylase